MVCSLMAIIVQHLGPSPWQERPLCFSDLPAMDPYGHLCDEAPRICMGWSPKRQRLIFNEGFGQWKSVPLDIIVTPHMNLVIVDRYYWEWDFDQVHEEELDAAAESQCFERGVSEEVRSFAQILSLAAVASATTTPEIQSVTENLFSDLHRSEEATSRNRATWP